MTRDEIKSLVVKPYEGIYKFSIEYSDGKKAEFSVETTEFAVAFKAMKRHLSNIRGIKL